MNVIHLVNTLEYCCKQDSLPNKERHVPEKLHAGPLKGLLKQKTGGTEAIGGLMKMHICVILLTKI